jgi:hypothetical protein
MLVFLGSAPLFLGIYILFRKTNEDIKPRTEDALESKGVFIMALEDGNGMVMPVTPMYGNAYNNGGFGGFGNDGFSYLIILFLFAMFGGWGNGFGGGFGGGNELYPWMNQSNQINGGFRDQMINSNIDSIQAGINGIQTQLCNGFAGVEQSANTRQIADMQQAFAAQTAMGQGFNAVQGQLANCCYENRLATANLGADIAREACATRTSDTQNTQVILNAINDGFRQMSDQRYQDKIDAKNDEIAQLRQENLYARGQASQTAQTAQIRAGQVAEIDAMYNRLKDCPVPTMPVYGMTPIFTCPNNSGCGCGI